MITTSAGHINEVDRPLGRAWDRLPQPRPPGRLLRQLGLAGLLGPRGWAGTRPNGRGSPWSARATPCWLPPLVARTRYRWESAGGRAIGTARPRWRPVLGTEEPDPEVLALLVEQVATAGAWEPVLHPAPDPRPGHNGALLGALRDNGFHVHQRQRSRDHIAVVEGGWRSTAAASPATSGR